jgi:hypothetical protein
MTTVTGETMRRVLLEVVAELSSRRRSTGLQSSEAINQAALRLGIRKQEGNIAVQQALLSFWSDLFRTGYLAWGSDLSNDEPPFCHVTELGRRALAHLSRDPANPDGYLAYLNGKAPLNPVAASYIGEALRTFNADCYRATAVMVGAAIESVALDVRDDLVAKLRSLGRPVSKGLSDGRIQRVLDSIESTLRPLMGSMPKALSEAFEVDWPSFTRQIRSGRNEAGHPTGIDAITQDQVHASLLVFPELAALALGLCEWIKTSIV